jgi:hypothetical protein
MIHVDRSIRKPIWDASKEVLEQWVGTELSPTSLYGVRVYGEGSILAPHVDRTPLVISAIINVAQDVDEPWPLEVYGHDGNAYNITIEPGEMIFYESHSVIHGRPFPLKGRYYAVSVIFASISTVCINMRTDTQTHNFLLLDIYRMSLFILSHWATLFNTKRNTIPRMRKVWQVSIKVHGRNYNQSVVMMKNVKLELT